ncbi:MAG: hypothetical protein ACREUU_09710, partial [Gammaproteobacteria bacterium]
MRYLRAVVLSMLLTGAGLHAQTWDGGGGNNNWSTGLNWIGDVAPANNGSANLFFAGAIRPTPLVDFPWSINSLTLNAGAAAFTISGSGLTIGTGGVTNNSLSALTINNGITLSADQSWHAANGSLIFGGSVNVAAQSLNIAGANNTTISGILAGTGSINKTNSGILTLSGAALNTFSGTYRVNQGTVALNKTPGIDAIRGALEVGDGLGAANSDVVRLGAPNQIQDSSTSSLTTQACS